MILATGIRQFFRDSLGDLGTPGRLGATGASLNTNTAIRVMTCQGTSNRNAFIRSKARYKYCAFQPLVHRHELLSVWFYLSHRGYRGCQFPKANLDMDGDLGCGHSEDGKSQILFQPF